MTKTQHVGFVGRGRGRWHCGVALGLALLAGCAAPAARDSATPADKSATQSARTESAAPAAGEPAAKPIAAEPAQPAPQQPPAVKAQPEAKPSTAQDRVPARVRTDDVKVSTEAEREALAQLIKIAAAEAQKEAAERQAASGNPPTPNSQPTIAPTTKPAEAGPAASAPTGTPRMELKPAEFDFKEVWQGMPAEGEINIKNVGTAPLTLDTRSSCGCTVATKPKSPLEPGEATNFKISYNTSHAGPAQKTVTISSNDPDRPSVVIKVTGTVKTLVAATPSDRIFFNDLEPNSVQSQTIRLEPKYDSPLNLKLRENQKFGPFTIDFKEVEAGKVYELTATTKPPVPTPTGNVTVFLETGLEKLPTIPIYVSANVPPRVAVTPPQLVVAQTATQPAQQILQVQYRGATPVEITEIKASADSVKWEVLQDEPAAASAKVRAHRVRVTLPPYDALPDGGASLQIFTSDSEEQYKRLDVRIIKARPPVTPRGQRTAH